MLDVQPGESPKGVNSRMSMMYTPTMDAGARTLPINLRDSRAAHHGLYRLHGNMAPVTEHPINLSGLGMFCDDTGLCTLDSTDTGGYVDLSQISQIPTESPYPVVVSTEGPGGLVQSQSMTPAQLTALINAGSASIQRILAITQGGSVLANGSIIGSQGAAQLAAAQSGLQISTQGLSGVLSNPLVLLGGLGIIALVLLKK